MTALTEDLWLRSDRRFFQTHPQRQFRIRRLHTGEFFGYGTKANAVVVQRVADGVRARYAVGVDHPTCTLTEALRQLDHDEALLGIPRHHAAAAAQ